MKYVGDLNGSSQPVLMKVPLNNVKLSVGDAVTLFNSAQAGYLGLAVTVKSILGVLVGFVHADGRPVTPKDLPASATTTSTGPTCLDLTVNADGDAYGLVSVSPTAVYSIVVATAPTAGTIYAGGGGDITTVTSGGQKMEVVSAGTWSGKTLLVVPWNSYTGIDANDATRETVVIKENELFGIIQT